MTSPLLRLRVLVAATSLHRTNLNNLECLMRPDTVSPHVHCRMLFFSPASYIHFLKRVVTEAHFDVLCRMLLSMKTVQLENVKYDERCEWLQ